MDLPRFDRRFFDGSERFTRIGDGSVGGKGAGLLRIHDLLLSRSGKGGPAEIEVSIPTLTVITTDLFDAFLDRNGLRPIAYSDQPDDRIAHAFQRAELPTELLGDLRALVQQVKQPLAVRSSSLLEDALFRPFAGVYATKMIPNNQHDADSRFRRLAEAVKLVYASTFFKGPKRYVRMTGRTIEEEKMAVLIQEVVGRRHGERFYPDLSGVARSYNFYRSGSARPEHGVIDLALGLGKTIVDGGLTWSYSPTHPKAVPPFASVDDMLEQTQTRFWAVNMGRPPAFDPTRETEYLVQAGLPEAEADGTLPMVASSYDAASDRLQPGLHGAGPRIVNFAPILVHGALPLNGVVKRLLADCESSMGEKVEIEFALTLPGEGKGHTRFGFLQVRPLVVSHTFVEITPDERNAEGVLITSDNVMGNGVVEGVQDVVYVRPDRFDRKWSRQIAEEIAAINGALVDAARPYLLLGFGRWGSSDPSLGIPVSWEQICGVRVMVEATLSSMNVELSQGSHFFHNMSSFEVSYFCVRHDRSNHRLDWNWLERQPAEVETERVRHLRLAKPLGVKVDGRTGSGVISRSG